jgi:uncharacterized membrane protein YqaE (UPF0057 family)
MLFLCYTCPPLAVLMMGRPFSSVLNMFLCCMFYVPGVKHALSVYADYKINKVSGRLEGAIHNPAWTRPSGNPVPGVHMKRGKYQPEVVVVYDNPYVGKNGTYFRPKN